MTTNHHDIIKTLRAAFLAHPVDWVGYCNRLRAMADACEPDAPADDARLLACRTEALRASARPGHVISKADELRILADSDALVDAQEELQHATREAFAEARRLVDRYGEDDPRTFAAIIKAVELQDPGCCKRMAAECGIHLPTPTHCDAEGAPLYSLEKVAQALDADPDDLHEQVTRLEEAGFDVCRQPAGRVE